MVNAVNLTINDISVDAKKGDSILEAAARVGIKIPSLCLLNMHTLDVHNRPASCRVCMVEEVGGRKGGIVPACATFVSDGMVVYTNSKRAIDARRAIVELMLSDHPTDCLTCDRNLTCELQALAADLGIKEVRYKGEKSQYPVDNSSYSVLRDPNKCILCRRCETVCSQVQTVGVLSGVDRGFPTTVGTAFNTPLSDTQCTFCGQCVAVCPTAALAEADDTEKVWKALNDPDKYVIVQTAPAIRATLGEMFGLPAGEDVTSKMIAALRRIGFKGVYDTNFAADLTVVEESAELMDRLKNGGKLPMIMSCCPSWIRFIEYHYPELLPHVSSCKSPQQMFGALAKTYLAEKLGVDPSKMVCVSIMPCLAKKAEAVRPELAGDVDYVLSTRELGQMIKEACIFFPALPSDWFDSYMGESSGGANIFGTSGGMLEAALRTTYETTTGKRLYKLEFDELRGFSKGIKDAELEMGDNTFKVAVAQELRNARILLDEISAGKSEYFAIEIMACPGGCISGGGQLFHKASEELLDKRRESLYKMDTSKSLRRPHENTEVKKLYDEFLGHPLSDKAHDLLHTGYTERKI